MSYKYENSLDFPSINTKINSSLNKDGTYSVESQCGRGQDTGQIVTRTELTQKQFENYIRNLGAKEALARTKNL